MARLQRYAVLVAVDATHPDEASTMVERAMAGRLDAVIMPTDFYRLTAEDVDTITAALDDLAARIHEQQRMTHDYTPSDLRTAARRRKSVLRALRLKED